MYILECSDGSYYVGSTWDPARRVHEHNSGRGGAYTRRRQPVELVYAEWFDSIYDAYVAEKRVQGWGRRKRRMLIEGRQDELPGSGSRSKEERAARAQWQERDREERERREGGSRPVS